MEKAHKQEQSLFLIYMLFSCMVHAMFLLVLCISFYAPELPPMLESKPLEPSVYANNHTDVAELKSGPGTFGAPITFDQLPDVQSTSHNQSSLDQDQTFFTETAQDDANESKPEETGEIQEINVQNEYIETQALPELSAASAPVKPVLGKKRRKSHKKRGSNNKGIQQQQKGNPLTFAKLMQGFLDSLDEGGKEFISRKGNPNKRPDNNELKYISYTQKIAWYLQQAWKIDPPIITTFPTQDKTLYITMTIDKDGTLLGLNVNHYSGITEFDTKIVSGIRNAGPFPPIPDHFNSQTHTISFGIVLMGNPFATQQAHQKTHNAVVPRARIVK
jgi:hypothetical protein